MKVIGLIGGLSWESTAHYYSFLNKLVHKRIGGHASAKLLLYSMDFAELQQLQFAGAWGEAGELMVDAASRLERGGADLLLICANTMHICAPTIEARSSIPLLHIADAAGRRIVSSGIRRIGLLGTAFTMEKDFYTGRLRERFGLEVLVPHPEDRRTAHEIIYDELVHGVVTPASKAKYREVIAKLAQQGAEGVLLACTELMMLIEASDSSIPLFDTTAIHCEAAVDCALSS